jgi:SAM-dependent methyltransferase
MAGWLRALRRTLFPGWRLPNRMDSILALVGECRRVLDIGCGTGQVAAHVKDRWPQAHIVGLDFKAYAEGTREPLDDFVAYDLSDLLQPGARLPLEDAAFDTVLLTEVIEHLVQPHLLLAEIHRVLEPGGALVVTCPNLHALENRLAVLLGTRGALFPSQMAYNLPADVDAHRDGHKGTYTFFTLRRLLGAMAFRVERRLGFDFPVPLLRHLRGPLTRLFPSWAFHVGVRAVREELPGYAVEWGFCARTDGKELILPGERCVCPHPHAAACHGCPFFHLNWLHPRDPRRGPAMEKTAALGRELPTIRVEPFLWRRSDRARWPAQEDPDSQGEEEAR